MTTWPEMQLPLINLYNAPTRGKDAIVSDTSKMTFNELAECVTALEDELYDTKQQLEQSQARVDEMESDDNALDKMRGVFILRKQAEAIERLFNECSIKSMSGTYIWSEGVINEANRLRQQADELEQR